MKPCIENDIMANAVMRGKTRLYTYPYALQLVANCEQNGVPVLGIDAFTVSDAKTQPHLEHSADWSNAAESKNTFDLARAFLKEKQPYGFLFEVVY